MNSQKRRRTNQGGAGNAVLRAANRARVLAVFEQGEQCARSDLARVLELTRPTVGSIVDELLEMGVVQVLGMDRRKGGRPVELLALNPFYRIFGGVHFGEEQLVLAVADALGNLRTTEQHPMVKGDPAQMMGLAARRLKQLVEKVGSAGQVPSAIGVSVPGLVERDDGLCRLAPNLNWRDVQVSAFASDWFAGPVAVANTTQVAALAEVRQGVATGVDDFVWVYVDDGVGACAVVNGQIQYGRRGFSGEIGHCQVEPNGLPCSCGGRGCLETVCSNRAVVARANGPHGKPQFESVAQVIEAARSGQGAARSALTDGGGALGRGLASLINLYDPEMVVLGGALFEEERYFTEAAARARLLALDGRHVRFVRSALGNDIYLKGAVLLAREKGK